MEFNKEYKEVLAGGQEMTVKITATIEGKGCGYKGTIAYSC